MKIETVSWWKVNPHLNDGGTYYGEYGISVRHIRPFESWRSPCYKTYVGESTVWHNASTGERCDTLLEALLADQVWLIEDGKLNRLESR